ncbi:diguanylate cyclase [Rhodoferax saidenbachensis]|uniref:diguanylate cyclase n=1 Tax=Rhodoferax saidenbachensis TaxID=1484693 RepID=A0ABU1ZN94_9BURK|nr:diguanylate cyclase [Rhodoferax saidenbachensis]MDR7307012.1 diguanylate cyclase (GGDEF)-like protein [Rhodoferax saidenbachensis]
MDQIFLHSLRKTTARWRAEDAQVADDATGVNLFRLRMLWPVAAALNGLFLIGFLWRLLGAALPQAVAEWNLRLIWVHTFIVGAALALGWVVHRARQTRHARAANWLATGCAVLIMLVGIVLVAVDQPITPNITSYLIACLLAGGAVYLRPRVAGLVYVLSYVVFFKVMGWTQVHPELVLSNRINGFAACVLGCLCSCFLWRQFCTITLQQRQLEKANTELNQKQRDLERLTRQDGLTGLFNRNTFVELSRRELDRAQRQGSSTTILLLDLDHFKRINDTWGHPAGDAVLRHVATLASTTVRSTDLVGRLGGEEFIVLLPNTSAEAGRKLAEKLRYRLESTPVQWEKTTIAVTASFGLANTTVEEKRDFDTLYTEADKALYLAKQRGRNRVV